MPGISFNPNTEDDKRVNAQEFDDRGIASESDDEEAYAPIDVELDVDDADSATLVNKPSRRTTDLVRLYLQEIGRVRLLGRDEEVAEAQKVQRYMQLKELRDEAATDDNPELKRYVHLIETRDRLSSQLGLRPSLERWASESGIDVTELKPSLAAGKRKWAELAGLVLEELEKIQTEGVGAKEHMIKANLRLVVSVAKKYQNRGLELLDLIQEGTLGLERAVEKFDPTRGYRFSTYAYWWIRQGITRAIATQSRTIRLPVHITEKLNKIKKAQRKLSQEKGRTPTIDDIAEELEMTPANVREVLLRVPRSVSLETKVGKEKDTELGDLLETDDISPEEILMREALQRDLQHLLADLTTRERDVIRMRFGLGDGHPYSLAEIGRALDLSRERVRQIEAKALQKLRQPKRRNRVRDYLEALS
ncbi:RNA polymerase sigma factor SigC [Oxynema aestuarii]|jgi:RNA polymerase nonessential primary-like sigma factor|uniref:RNA polymerase sigma factor n=1 Tax=Oxynema aestuarii AP17 TaxID=2064643 RepID=A0A6H1TVN7_9CYAN|nr:RNA polymerase sigma factor SigC [Oxynema aestuarii]QIZ70652.1 RNA polymerase sigma factor SigC [Oxynema aestuarii AP17]